jgi:hypothetical protein
MRHRQQRERNLPQAFERFGALERVVGIGADSEDDNDRRIVASREARQQSQERLAVLPPLGAEQFLRLVDRDDESRRPFGLVASDPSRRRRLGKLGQQWPQGASSGLPCRAQLRARTRRQDGGERVDQAGLAGQRRAPGTNHGQGNELRIVAVEPRQQTRAQERRLARAGGAEDRHQSRRRSRSKSPQPVDGVDDRRVAAKENAGVVRLLRLQAAIGGAIRLLLRRPVKPRVEPCLL